jgi:hypothetical protein
VDNEVRKLFLGFWGLVLAYVLFMGSLSLKSARDNFQLQVNLPEEFKELLRSLELVDQTKATWTDGGFISLQTNPFVNKVIVAKKQEKIESPSSLPSQLLQPPTSPPGPPLPPTPPPPPPPPTAFYPQGANNGTVFYSPFLNATVQNATLRSENVTSSKKVLILTSIIQAEENKVCVIDNKVYRVGDEIKKHRILKIGEDYVELQGPKRKFKIKVGDTLDI